MSPRVGRPPLPTEERRRRRAEASRRTTERERAGRVIRSLLLTDEQRACLECVLARGGHASASALVQDLVLAMRDARHG